MKLVPHKRVQRHPATINDAMSRLFDESFWDPLGAFPSVFDGKEVQYLPKVDLSETGDAFHVVADLPGYDSHDVSVEINDGVLTIKGTMKEETEDKDAKWHCRQCSSGSFFQRFSLPTNIDESGIVCKSKNGKLKITVPKTGELKPGGRTIAIDSE